MGRKSPSRNHKHSGTSLQVQGPPRSPLTATALPGDTGRGDSPPGLSWGRGGPAPLGHTAPQTIPSIETGTNQRDELASAQLPLKPARRASPAREQRLSASLPAAGLGSQSASPSPGSLPARQQSGLHSRGCGKMTRQRVRPLWGQMCNQSPGTRLAPLEGRHSSRECPEVGCGHG